MKPAPRNRIVLPVGQIFTPELVIHYTRELAIQERGDLAPNNEQETTTMNETHTNQINATLSKAASEQMQVGQANSMLPRDLATVAAELQGAINAAARIKPLREELATLLGRKPRKAKGDK